MQGTMEDRSLGELFGLLADQTKTLVNHEVALAKAEAAEKAKTAGKGVAFLAAGGFVAYAGLLAVIAGIILLVGQWVPMWVSALIIGIIVALVGYLLIQKGRNDLKAENLKPQQTAASLRENKEWLQEQVR
ncbi:MAG: phage holin family protein [Anaerolineae bacterium]|nr:phage holin family protein [Anaerolineae bacterium]